MARMTDGLIVDDLIVVGAGSGGYARSRTARDVGCDVRAGRPADHSAVFCICAAACPASPSGLRADGSFRRPRCRPLGNRGRQSLRSICRSSLPARRVLVKEFADYRHRGKKFILKSISGTRPPIFLSPEQLLRRGEHGRSKTDRFVIATGSSCQRRNAPAGFKRGGP